MWVDVVLCSYVGACQLELDVLYVRTWLASYVTESALRRRLLDHEALAYMDAAASLLKQQPPVVTGRRRTSNQRRQTTKQQQHPRQYSSPGCRVLIRDGRRTGSLPGAAPTASNSLATLCHIN